MKYSHRIQSPYTVKNRFHKDNKHLMWDINYPYADNLYPKWDIWGPTWDVSSHPMWDPKHPTLDTNYLHTDNIKAVLRFESNIPCGMLDICMRMFRVLRKAEKRKIFKMADTRQ